jgi:NADH dehydrogenase
VSIRSFLRRATFRMLGVTGLDLDGSHVLARDPATGQDHRIPYDHLVIALGSVTMLPPVPGLRQHGLQMKSMADAIALRDRAILMLEAADADAARRAVLLHFVIVGANFTGAEVAGEFQAFLSQAVRRYPNLTARDIRITLIDKADRILAALSPDLSEYARANLVRRGIDVRLGQTVASIDASSATLSTGERLEARTVIWAAGIAPPPALAGFGLPVDPRGYVICERDLRVRGHRSIWGIGDCAVNADASGHAYPATAQHAVREGVWAARNIARVLRGQEPTPCDLKSQGSLAALGCRTGVAVIFGVKLSGFPAWWMWRTVYLLKMPGLARKLRIALDWTLDLFFRRDYVQLGVHRSDGGAR